MGNREAGAPKEKGANASLRADAGGYSSLELPRSPPLRMRSLHAFDWERALRYTKD